MRLRTSVVLAGALAVLSCGSKPSQVGTLVDRVGIEKVRLGDAPDDLPSRQATAVRMATADVLGDARPEVLVSLPNGRGVEVRDESGTRLRLLPTREYVTDLGAIPSASSDKEDLVLYLYPNAEGGGTFQVLSADQQERATWRVSPPASQFAVSTWAGMPALVYLQGDAVQVSDRGGESLARLPAPDGHIYANVRAMQTGDGRFIVVASGNGYTPYHMVCVYDGEGQLVFQEVGDEQAFALEPGAAASSFVVSTRSSRWEYRMKPAAGP